MAEITKSGTPSLATPTPGPEHSIVGLLAGEAIAAGDACTINSAGAVVLATGAAANAAAAVRGFAPRPCDVGEAITLFHGVVFRYGSALTPGANYYLSGTVAGGIADAASTGGTAAIGFAIDATRIFVNSPR